MRTIKLTIAYDGTNYAGWQSQAPSLSTVQDAIERVLNRMTGETIRVVASGRTDSGVHALAQVVCFRTHSTVSPEVFLKALNGELPRDIAVLDAAEAALDFHAIRDAVRKRYRYVLNDGAAPDVFRRNYSWRVWPRLDAEAMHRAALAWRGTHDFASFEASGSRRLSTVRTVLDLRVARGTGELADLVTYEVEADGFLYNMVRIMVGTLVEVGKGRQPPAWAAEVLAARDRRAAGITAPALGLFLVRVDYE